jgi:hypothetical protein
LDLLGSLLLLLLALDGSALVLDTLLSPLAGGLGLGTLGIHLLLELGLAGGLSLGLVNLFELLEDVQYGCMVAAVVMASQELVT